MPTLSVVNIPLLAMVDEVTCTALILLPGLVLLGYVQHLVTVGTLNQVSRFICIFKDLK